MVIYVHDGLRHRQLTGYGVLARHLMLGLHDRGHQVIVQQGDRAWAEVELGVRERIESLRAERLPPSDTDVVLQVGQPGSCRSFDIPTAIYTQNALGGLLREWVSVLGNADMQIVPGEFDRRVFVQEFPRVRIAPQGSNPAVFKPVPKWRAEGSDRFTFLFVGSYGFRKGVDILLQAFLEEFSPAEPVELWLYCVGLGDGVNHLLRTLQKIQPLANVRVSTSAQSPAWMCRHYNRADCVVTTSRGEGWCMPLTEALLCGKPVIAPNSTAMGEYLTDDTAYLLPATELPVSEIATSFGESFRKRYGEPGITHYEVSIEATRAAMRRVVENRDEACERASRGRALVLDRYDWRSAAGAVEAALLDLLAA